MKEKVVIIFIILIFSYISTPFINNLVKKPKYIDQGIINIAIADNIWDYLNRFSLNN